MHRSGPGMMTSARVRREHAGVRSPQPLGEGRTIRIGYARWPAGIQELASQIEALDRVCLPLARRARSPSRARISRPAPAAAATTSRSIRPVRSSRVQGRPSRSAAARRSCRPAAASPSSRVPHNFDYVKSLGGRTGFRLQQPERRAGHHRGLQGPHTGRRDRLRHHVRRVVRADRGRVPGQQIRAHCQPTGLHCRPRRRQPRPIRTSAADPAAHHLQRGPAVQVPLPRHPHKVHLRNDAEGERGRRGDLP
jgi:hypothetical protein